MKACWPASTISPKSFAPCSPAKAAARGDWAFGSAASDGSSAVIEAGLSAPSRERKHLLNLFKDKIEGIDMGFGVDLMAFAASVTETLLPAQTSLAASEEKVAAEPLIDRLVNRLGARAVRRLYPARKPHPRIGAKRAERLDAECLGTKCLGTRRRGANDGRLAQTQAAAPPASLREP